jgi:hypothetical protein
MTITLRTIGLAMAWTAGWAWALLAGVGGLMLLVHEGPLPITNGWFAMFSGVAACPLTARLLERGFGITVSGWVQFGVAVLIMIAGRIAVVAVLHRPFLPGPWPLRLGLVSLVVFGGYFWQKQRTYRDAKRRP